MKNKGAVEAFENIDEGIHLDPEDSKAYNIEVQAVIAHYYYLKKKQADKLIIKFKFKKIISTPDGAETVEDRDRYMKVDPEFARTEISNALYNVDEWDDTINLLTSIDWTKKKSIEQYIGLFEYDCSHGPRTRHNPSCCILYTHEFDVQNLQKPRVPVDQRIVNQVRYNRVKRRWEGLVGDPIKTSIGTLEVLSDAWVATNLNKDLVEKLKTRGKTNFRYNRIPPGNPRMDSTVPNHLSRDDAPVMKYIQGQKRTCVTDSMASAFFYLNYELLAHHIHELGKVECANETNSMNMLSVTKNELEKKKTFFPVFYQKG
jgi:hypothetical protein